MLRKAGETSAGRVIPYLADPKVLRSAWQRQKDAANRHYEPGKFTTLIAFEWTSIPYAQNLPTTYSSLTMKGQEDR